MNRFWLCTLVIPMSLAISCDSPPIDSTPGGDVEASRVCPRADAMAVGWPGDAELPAGPCSQTDLPCRATVVEACSDGSFGQIRENECRCTGGAWSCTVVSKTKGACKAPVEDGGAADSG